MPDDVDPSKKRLLGQANAHLDEARRHTDRLAAERRGQFRAPMPTPLMFDDEDTSIERISQLVAAEVAEQMPRPPVVIEVHKTHSSAPPSSRSRTPRWALALAAILPALGGAAGLKACADSARQAVPHRAPPVASTHP